MSTSRASRNQTLPIVLGLGGALTLCTCIFGVLGLSSYYFYQKNQTVADPAVIYVLDASPRMSVAMGASTRLDIAREVLAEVVRPADPTVKAGLRVFGSGAAASGCEDTELLVPLAPATQSQIADITLNLNAGASSDSALGQAMLAAIKDVSAAKGPHTLVVITGGPDSCNAKASELIKQEAERVGINLQEFVIGLGVTAEEAAAIKDYIEIANGNYLNAPDADILRNILLAINAYVDEPSSATLMEIQAAAEASVNVNFPTESTTVAEAIATESEATSTPAAHQPQTACDHPYMPLRPGATWKYSNGNTWAVESVEGDLNSATATVISTHPDGGFWTFTWNCSAVGLDVYHTGNSYMSNMTFVVTDQAGAMLVAISDLIPGATWRSSHTQTTTGEFDIAVAQLSALHVAGDLQSVSLNGDTFEVIPVISSYTRSRTVTRLHDGAVETSSFDDAYTVYFAKGIGLLRVEGFAPNLPEGRGEGIELVSYDIPEQ